MCHRQIIKTRLRGFVLTYLLQHFVFIEIYLDSHYYVLVSLLTKTTGFTISGRLCQLNTKNLAGKREMRKQSKHKKFLFWKQVNYYEIWLFVFISSIMWKLTCLQMSSIRLASQELPIFEYLKESVSAIWEKVF